MSTLDLFSFLSMTGTSIRAGDNRGRHEVRQRPRPPCAAHALKPAVPIKKSVMADYIICLDDGKKFKSLKRHLSTHYGLTPDEYRAKWGLRGGLSHGRAELHRCALGLGQDHGARPQTESETPAPAKRTDKKIAA